MLKFSNQMDHLLCNYSFMIYLRKLTVNIWLNVTQLIKSMKSIEYSNTLNYAALTYSLNLWLLLYIFQKFAYYIGKHVPT